MAPSILWPYQVESTLYIINVFQNKIPDAEASYMKYLK